MKNYYSFKKYILRVATGTSKPTFNFQPWNIQSDDTNIQLNVSNMHSQPNFKQTFTPLTFSQDSDKAGDQTSSSRSTSRTTSTKGSDFTEDNDNRDLAPSRSSSTANSDYTEEEENRNLEPWGMGDLSFAKF